MSDLIHVADLEVWARLGVPEKEREQAQRLLITLEMQVANMSIAAAEDDIRLAVNYAEVARAVETVAGTRPRKLLETLAEEVATALLGQFPIQELKIEIKKFVLPNTRYVSVCIRRPRLE